MENKATKGAENLRGKGIKTGQFSVIHTEVEFGENIEIGNFCVIHEEIGRAHV